jgi:hypothetical protein
MVMTNLNRTILENDGARLAVRKRHELNFTIGDKLTAIVSRAIGENGQLSEEVLVTLYKLGITHYYVFNSGIVFLMNREVYLNNTALEDFETDPIQDEFFPLFDSESSIETDNKLFEALHKVNLDDQFIDNEVLIPHRLSRFDEIMFYVKAK